MAERLASVNRRCAVAVALAVLLATPSVAAGAAGKLRFGIDPEVAGSAGSTQNPSKPVNEARTLRALRALRPPGKQLVLRVNRLFESDGEAGIRRFKRIVDRYTRQGFDTELQVR